MCKHTVHSVQQYAQNVCKFEKQTIYWVARAFPSLLPPPWQADGRDRQARFGDRIWILMPFMHSEDVEDQRTCVKEFERLRDEAAALGAEDAAKQFAIYAEFATKHLNVVEHWRRFPHRNVLLGRESTPEELAGLADGTIAAF